MSKSAKILLGGLILAGAIWGGAEYREAQLQQKVQILEAKCLKEDAETRKPGIEWTLVCEAESLLDIPDESVGVQKEIADAYWKSVGAGSDLKTIAVIVALLSAVPWLWYFLLRRLAEVREAIRGNPPDS